MESFCLSWCSESVRKKYIRPAATRPFSERISHADSDDLPGLREEDQRAGFRRRQEGPLLVVPDGVRDGCSRRRAGTNGGDGVAARRGVEAEEHAAAAEDEKQRVRSAQSRAEAAIVGDRAASHRAARIARRRPVLARQRYHFIPDAQLLVTIPTNADRLVLRKLNVDEALEKSGIDFLFVASAPVPQATPGKEYSYPVAVKSKKGGLKYKVDAGPAGMKVSPTGTVSWKVPADFKEAQVDVIMTISDSSGQEIFHTFKIAIAEAAKEKGDAK